MPVYKDEAQNTWYVKVNITQFAGKHKSIKKRGFKTKREATAYEKEILNRYNNIGGLTFSAFARIYIEEMKTVLAPSTLQERKSIFKKHIFPKFGNMPLNSITADIVQDWQNELLENVNLKPSTISHITAALSGVFKHAGSLYNLKNNPFDTLYSPVPGRRKQYTIWSPTDLQKAVMVCSSEDTALAIKILYFMGLRIGELYALTPEDLDPREKAITVSRSYSTELKIMGPPKTPQSVRKLLLPPHLYDELENYIASHQIPAKDRIFKGVLPGKIRTALKKAGQTWNQPALRIHDLRHSNASLLNDLGFSPFVIKNRMGHNSIGTTVNIYTQIFNKQEESLANHLDYMENAPDAIPPYPIILDIRQKECIVTIPDFPEMVAFKAYSLDEAKTKAFALIRDRLMEMASLGKEYPSPHTVTSIPVKKNRIILMYS